MKPLARKNSARYTGEFNLDDCWFSEGFFRVSQRKGRKRKSPIGRAAVMRLIRLKKKSTQTDPTRVVAKALVSRDRKQLLPGTTSMLGSSYKKAIMHGKKSSTDPYCEINNCGDLLWRMAFKTWPCIMPKSTWACKGVSLFLLLDVNDLTKNENPDLGLW